MLWGLAIWSMVVRYVVLFRLSHLFLVPALALRRHGVCSLFVDNLSPRRLLPCSFKDLQVIRTRKRYPNLEKVIRSSLPSTTFLFSLTGSRWFKRDPRQLASQRDSLLFLAVCRCQGDFLYVYPLYRDQVWSRQVGEKGRRARVFDGSLFYHDLFVSLRV